jgi:hypothetical protein
MLKDLGMLVVVSTLFAGCAVPMENANRNYGAKMFTPPSQGNSGLYIYRNSFFGQDAKIDVWV